MKKMNSNEMRLYLNKYLEWDGTYTTADMKKASRNYDALMDTLNESEIDLYFDLCEAHVYATTRREDRKTALALIKFCNNHNFSIYDAMITY